MSMEGSVLANKSAKDRHKADYYPTPDQCTQALIDFLGIPRSQVIWECACGDGFISKVLQKNGYKVISTDINHYGFEDSVEDFLLSDGKECDWIITNPPFSLADKFIRKAISLGKPFAMLLKSQYWHSKKRFALFQQHKPKFVLPMTWRPDFEFGRRGGSPTMDCIWTVWMPVPTASTIYEPINKP